MSATDVSRFPCIEVCFTEPNLRHQWTSEYCTPFYLTQGAQATPASNAQKIASPGWRPSSVWYLAEAPALSAVAGNPVPAFTLLSRFSPPERNPLSLCRRRTSLRYMTGLKTRATFSSNQKWNQNQSWLARTRFPALCVSFMYCFEFWLVHCIVCTLCDWL